MSVIIWDLILWPTAPPFALKSDNSFGVCLSNCDMNVDSSDMPLILRNSSQICKEKYTILVTYQSDMFFFCDLNNMRVLDTISFQSNENRGQCQAVKEHIHYIVIFKYEKCKNEM